MFLLPLPLLSRPSPFSKGSTTSNGSNRQRQRKLHTISSIINNALLSQLDQECQLQPDSLCPELPQTQATFTTSWHLPRLLEKMCALPLIPSAPLRGGWTEISLMPGSHWLEFVVLIIHSNLQRALDSTGNQVSWNSLVPAVLGVISLPFALTFSAAQPHPYQL